MTATPTRIGFVIEPYRRAVSQTPAVATRHGNLARESADPIDSYFASVAVAQVRADERQALLSPDRRLFSAITPDVEAMLPLLDVDDEENDGALPTVRYIDTERGIDMSAIVAEVVIDTEAHAATIKFWG
ncbi:MAG TPA: hypothetical protein VMQ93_08740 [Novosphingobium sp.]|nr:hypothetical protein [Novosphingobium sp.]